MGEIAESRTNQTEVNRFYWDAFYRQVSIDQESTFCKAVKPFIPVQALIIDVGCGSGRDSFAFAAASFAVIGIDRSGQAIQQNLAKKDEISSGNDDLDFRMIDFSDGANLNRFLTEIRRESRWRSVPVTYYLRFLLHAIDETTEQILLHAMSANTVAGDLWALEFRTLEDAAREKLYDNHYRRFIDHEALKKRLLKDGNFECLFEQTGTGLSVYKQEDPHLCRLIMRKK